MRKQLTLVLMLALTIAMVGTTLTYAGGRGSGNGGQGQGNGQGQGQGGGMNLHDSLTEEQHTALHDKATEMREAGATREEIQKARREMLEGYGVELPENWGKRSGYGLDLDDNLTEEQQTALHDKVTEMKEAGAAREEIQKTVGAMLEGYGVELPEDFGKRGEFGGVGSGTDHEDCSGDCEDCASEESAAAPEETVPDVTPSARIAATTAVQSASWGQIKSRMK